LFGWELFLNLNLILISGKINVKTFATKVDENASVPASIFDVPSDIQIVDRDAK
jgi:hypothetical protein